MNNKVSEYRAIMDENRMPVLRETSSYCCDNEKMYNAPDKIVAFVNEVFQMDSLCEESMYMLAFDNKHHLLGVFEVSHGIVNASFARGREIFMRLLLVGAASFVLVHNHPSGDVTPSKEDITVVKTITDLSKLMEITFDDNIIVGRNRYYSFREEGRMG